MKMITFSDWENLTRDHSNLSNFDAVESMIVEYQQALDDAGRIDAVRRIASGLKALSGTDSLGLGGIDLTNPLEVELFIATIGGGMAKRAL